VVVLWLALVGFGMLAVLAPMTGGFAAASRVQLVALSIAGVVSVVALSGVLSVAALVVGLVLLLAVIGRAFVR
jgi:histidinol dehydrogenase